RDAGVRRVYAQHVALAIEDDVLEMRRGTLQRRAIRVMRFNDPFRGVCICNRRERHQAPEQHNTHMHSNPLLDGPIITGARAPRQRGSPRKLMKSDSPDVKTLDEWRSQRSDRVARRSYSSCALAHAASSASIASRRLWRAALSLASAASSSRFSPCISTSALPYSIQAIGDSG